MYEGVKVAVVVPCFNEVMNIASVIDKIPDYVDRVYVVDDKSTDDTVAVARKRIAETDKPITLLIHDRNQGVGGAIVTGYKQAIADEMDAVAVMAGMTRWIPIICPRCWNLSSKARRIT